MAPGYDTDGFTHTVEFARVKYDFGQLWRWKVILDRFSLSAGNTIGILGADVDANLYGSYYGYENLIWLNGAKPVKSDPLWGRDWSTVRNILVVWAEKSLIGGAASALPRLLPALGIPTDAVGLVRPADYGLARRVTPAIGGEDAVPVAAPQPAGAPADTPGAGDNPQAAGNVTDTAPNDATEAGPPPPGVAAPSDSPTSVAVVGGRRRCRRHRRAGRGDAGRAADGSPPQPLSNGQGGLDCEFSHLRAYTPYDIVRAMSAGRGSSHA